MIEDFLRPRQRAEDILLGSLGYSEEASLVTVQKMPCGYKGVGVWKDGTTFVFESKDSLSELELWAIEVLTDQAGSNSKKKRKAA